ncbi:DNA-(apurinic or apyrimidinic site) lyase /endonuclease III [Thermosporothrix hazakensis]|jgi:endonuclease-3|uniref:Endonuclease III n=1 Tax=Thermosporothrix hazakensis TaxID=644383 RepID=A0A326U7L0_THEHA|nr:endonuclease III [Thermosporothrix hazakensis]PZW29512.1 DNA-(apurinic or apyrimidinic site) lyase /endonuclease III [Thermosporothrix hazakensis]GCE45774.1 endonuclease III [Thermosporothrix hazakensis]
MTPYSGPAPCSQEQVQAIIKTLHDLYPNARYDLDFSTPLEMLVATILAAQCTDERVNAVTGELFKKYHTAADYANTPQEELEQDIKSITFFRNKARSIRAACQYMLDHYHGEVPQTIKELVKMPGIARKTANVILGNAFGISEGFIVDTHVARLSGRFGWSKQSDINKIEQDLMRIIPRDAWLGLAFRMIYHGRAICKARKPLCDQCQLAAYCPSAFTVEK